MISLDPLYRRVTALEGSVARLVTMKDALLGIAHMDVYTRDGEKPAHEVMREIALAALKEIER